MGFPLPVLPETFDIVRLPSPPDVTPDIREASSVADAFVSGKEDIIVPAFADPVMLLSQSCDAQRRERLAVARVGPVTEQTPANRHNLREGEILYLFHLPEIPGVLPESYVDFTRLYSVDRQAVDRFLARRIAGLTDLGRHRLAWALSQFFGRPA